MLCMEKPSPLVIGTHLTAMIAGRRSVICVAPVAAGGEAPYHRGVATGGGGLLVTSPAVVSAYLSTYKILHSTYGSVCTRSAMG